MYVIEGRLSVNEIEHLRPLLARGDAEAWRSLVHALAGPLFRYARPLSLDDDSAEEIVQQTFVRLQRAKLKPQGSLRTLAFHVATNLMRDRRRNQATRQRHEQEAAMPEATTNDPSRQAEAKEAWDKALQLPVELREVVLLRYGQGFTAAEAAAVLGIPEGTVKTRQRKALEDLRGSALAAPALLALESDLQAAATATQVPTTLAPNLEAIVMASIGTKTGTNAGILALAALLLIGGIGTGAYFLTGHAGNEQPGQPWPGPETTAKSVDERPNDAQTAPPVMAGPDATVRTNLPETSNNAAASPAIFETPEGTGNAAKSANGKASDDHAAEGDVATDEEAEEGSGFRARIAGRVVDYHGEGVAFANVHIDYFVGSIRDLGGFRQLTKQVTIRADARGIYSFEIESDGHGEDLSAHITHYAMPPDTPRVIDPGMRDVHLALRNGEERAGIRLVVQRLQYQGRLDTDADDPENPELGSHPYRPTFTGRVVDDQGLPVSGATVKLVYLWWLQSNPRTNRAYEKGPEGETDALGTFTLTLVGRVRDETVTARVIVTASAEGMAASERWSQPEVANGAEHEISFELHAAGTARGRVLDATGKPVQHARIFASMVKTDNSPPVSVLGDIDGNGNFELKGLAPGRWQISVISRTYPSDLGTPREPVEFDVTAGVQLRLPDIVLVTPTTVVIKPLQEDGKPFARNTEISLTVQKNRPGLWGTHRAKIDQQGRAVFRGIEPGTREAKLTVTGHDFEEHRLTLNVRKNQENDVGEIRLQWARDKAD